jgi:hypothetical protein
MERSMTLNPTVYTFSCQEKNSPECERQVDRDARYQGLNEEQIMVVEAKHGVAEIELDRDQVDANVARLSDESLMRAAEQGGSLSVLISVELVCGACKNG